MSSFIISTIFNFKSSEIGALELERDPDVHFGHLISLIRLLNLASSFSFSKLYKVSEKHLRLK